MKSIMDGLFLSFIFIQDFSDEEIQPIAVLKNVWLHKERRESWQQQSLDLKSH